MIDKGAAEMICHEFITDCKFWEDSTDVIASVDSIKIVNPDNENAILADKVKYILFLILYFLVYSPKA